MSNPSPVDPPTDGKQAVNGSTRTMPPNAFRILAMGEVLWDVFADGPHLGGAPLNFALLARALGGRAQILSRIGTDALGGRVREELARRDLETDFLQIDAHAPTGTATVGVSAAGEPTFTLAEEVAWDFIDVKPDMLEAAGLADAIYFGTLAQRSHRSRSAIQALVAAARPGALRILDANLRAPYFDGDVLEASLALATVLKINEAEFAELTAQFGIPGSSPEEQIAALADRFDLTTVACTLGAKGSIIHRNGETVRQASRAVKVVNTVGAGDSFAAVLTMGLLADAPLAEISRRANEAAAFVCSQPGATPALPPLISMGFERTNPSGGVSAKRAA